MLSEGVYVNKKVSTEEAKLITERHRGEPLDAGNGDGTMVSYVSFRSAIGHEGSAEVFNKLGFCNGTVTVNRVAATFSHGDEGICLKMLGRLPEGKILTIEEMEEIGFEFYYVKCFAGSWMNQVPCSTVEAGIEREDGGFLSLFL